MREVTLVAIGTVDRSLVDYLALMIGEVLRGKSAVSSATLSPDPAYDPVRRQHHSTKLLERLLDLADGSQAKVLGVTDRDLYIPILTFVFGEAHLGGRAGVLSTARLRQEFYGLPAEERLLYLRAEKEALHEIGHMFGLVHCADPLCVMRFSSSVEQVDLKGDRYCLECARKLGLGAVSSGAPRRPSSS